MKVKIFLSYFLFLTCLLIVSLSSVNAAIKQCSSIKYSSPSSEENDIEFKFGKQYRCGQFINGDWWVSVDSSGTLKVLAVTPESVNGLNGLELNPNSKNKQGFDKRISGYDSTLNIELPMAIAANTSIVKSVGLTSSKRSKCRPCLKFSVVLTVVESPIENSIKIFRPGYYGKTKFLYDFNDKVINQLPNYPISCCSKAKGSDFKRIARRYQGVQLDHIVGWTGRNLHPIDNMPDYGATIATDNAISALRFMIDDFSIENPVHKNALINYLQMSIDLQAMASGGVTWPGKGGHGNGRKLPILFAWHLLEDASFLDALKNSSFSEDEQVYFSDRAGKALFGSRCSDKQYWSTTRVGRGPRDCRDPYGYIDGGGLEIGGAYQFCCTAMPWKYTALAVRLLQKEAEWGNDAFLEYVDRWVSKGVWAKPDPCAPYDGNAGNYMKEYGRNKMGDCIQGVGRYTYKHGVNKDGGHYRNSFGDQLWKTIILKNKGAL